MFASTARMMLLPLMASLLWIMWCSGLSIWRCLNNISVIERMWIQWDWELFDWIFGCLAVSEINTITEKINILYSSITAWYHTLKLNHLIISINCNIFSLFFSSTFLKNYVDFRRGNNSVASSQPPKNKATHKPSLTSFLSLTPNPQPLLLPLHLPPQQKC